MSDVIWSPRPVVFVIDDETGIIRLCQRLLERAGFQVFTFTDPQAGLSVLEHQHVDLLLVDIRMPSMDGFQVIDSTRAHYPDLAVVVMTGFGTVETAIEALRRGADGLILKPFSGAELVESVRRALEQSQHKQDVLRLQALRPLFDVSESLFTETNPKRLRTLILEAVCGHLKCSHAEYYQTDSGGRQYSKGNPSVSPRLRLVVGFHPSLQRITNSNQSSTEGSISTRRTTQSGVQSIELRSGTGFLTEPIARRADALHAPLLIQLEEDTEPQLQTILINRGLGSVICAPVVLKEGAEVNGVLLAGRDSAEPRFRASDLEMLAVLARQAAVALENARLHAELRDYIRQVEDGQRALIQAEKLATAGRLTASIAHEINNPLQAVQNCLHLAGRKELSEEQQQNYLDMARTELERLMGTVQRMLDFYRPAALDRKPVELNQLLSKVFSLMDQQFKDHQITVFYRLQRDVPHVLAVADQIQQVFLNLFLNALEAMPNGGDIYIESALVKVPGNQDSRIPSSNQEIEVYVQDTGPGIPSSERKHIFEPFTSTKDKGTGLGLAVSYGIVTAHGGNLELVEGHVMVSEVGWTVSGYIPAGDTLPVPNTHYTHFGACFRVTLPIEEHT